MKKKRIVIIGGGTFSPIRNHLSLCAPAFGTTAKQLYEMIVGCHTKYDVELFLTKMADCESDLVTNDDVENLVADLINDESVKTIVMNAALCDFDADISDRGFHGKRLKTADGEFSLKLKPSDKVISSIRKSRPDIFLVAFKTTTGATKEEQFLTALKMMKSSKCSLVLANDTVTRHNMVVTPEETMHEADRPIQKEHREASLALLVEMILDRHDPKP